MREVSREEFVAALIKFCGDVLSKRDVDDRWKSGGVMRVARDDRLLHPVVLERFGIADDDRVAQCMRHAEEKTVRLAGFRGHVSGFQSANRDEKAWGGSIRAGIYIIAIAGLPWRLDEALALLVAREVKLLTFAEARAIAEISSNLFYLHMPTPAHLTQAHL